MVVSCTHWWYPRSGGACGLEVVVGRSMYFTAVAMMIEGLSTALVLNSTVGAAKKVLSISSSCRVPFLVPLLKPVSRQRSHEWLAHDTVSKASRVHKY